MRTQISIKKYTLSDQKRIIRYAWKSSKKWCVIKYKRIKINIPDKCRRDKENWLNERCEVIQQSFDRAEIDKPYARVKTLQPKQRTKSGTV